MTVVQPLSDAGLTQASSVIRWVRSREAASATVTQLLVPLKERAFPYLPAVVHVAPERVPVLLVPEESAVVVPAPSSKPSARTGAGWVTLTTIPVPGISMLQ